MKTWFVFPLLVILLVPVIIPDVLGHGFGIDEAPSISFDNRNVTVSTKLSPSDLTVGDIENAFVQVRFFDVDTNQTINDVTYGIEMWRKGELLARNDFYAVNGIMTIDVRPTYDCNNLQLWRCTNYYGVMHPIAGALYTYGNSNPVIQGPIFDKGGLYNIKVSVLGAESPKTLLTTPLKFELYTSVAQEQIFYITVPIEQISNVE